MIAVVITMSLLLFVMSDDVLYVFMIIIVADLPPL